MSFAPHNTFLVSSGLIVTSKLNKSVLDPSLRCPNESENLPGEVSFGKEGQLVRRFFKWPSDSLGFPKDKILLRVKMLWIDAARFLWRQYVDWLCLKYVLLPPNYISECFCPSKTLKFAWSLKCFFLCLHWAI